MRKAAVVGFALLLLGGLAPQAQAGGWAISVSFSTACRPPRLVCVPAPVVVRPPVVVYRPAVVVPAPVICPPRVVVVPPVVCTPVRPACGRFAVTFTSGYHHTPRFAPGCRCAPIRHRCSGYRWRR